MDVRGEKTDVRWVGFHPLCLLLVVSSNINKKWPERIFLLQQCLSFFPDLLRPLLESTATAATTTTSATIRSLAATRSIQIQSAWSRALKGSFPTHPNFSRFQRTSIHPAIFMFLRFFIETKRHAFFSRLHPKVVTGYIPSSVYLRSSYRSKQFPTLSTTMSSSLARGPIDYNAVNTSNVKTLPGSPYR